MSRRHKNEAHIGRSAKFDGSDFFPTPPEVTHALLDRGLFRRHLATRSTEVLEPACGDGAMSKVLEGRGFRVSSFDLFDRGYGIPGVDFLTYAPDASRPQFDYIVTNPPFSLAEEFVRKALTLARFRVALLLPLYFFAGADSRVDFLNSPFTRPAFILPFGYRVPFRLPGYAKPMNNKHYVWAIWNAAENRRGRGRVTIFGDQFRKPSPEDFQKWNSLTS